MESENNLNTLIENIKPLVEAVQQNAEMAVSIYNQKVNEIINSKCTNQNEIELTLDYMLGFCFSDEMLIIYKRLCRYYYTINPKATVDYINYYREMWDSET